MLLPPLVGKLRWPPRNVFSYTIMLRSICDLYEIVYNYVRPYVTMYQDYLLVS